MPIPQDNDIEIDGGTINSQKEQKEKREREEEEESRASKAIRTCSSNREKSKRSEDSRQEEPMSKIIRTERESGADVLKTLTNKRPVFNPAGRMVDAIDAVESEEVKHTLREEMVPILHIDGGSRKSGTHSGSRNTIYVRRIPRMANG